MTRLTSLLPIPATLFCTSALFICSIGLLNNLVYDFIQKEFWIFLIIFILSIVGLILLARAPVLYYDERRLIMIKKLKKEVFSLDDIDKVYSEGRWRAFRSFGFSTGSGHYVGAQILFKPILRREAISFVVEVPELEKFLQMLENR